MNNFYLIITGLIFSVSLNACAQVFIRKAVVDKELYFSLITFFNLFFSPSMWYGMICYIISIFLWIIVLSKIQVSLAYPFQAIGYIFGSLLAWYFLGERISVLNSLGLIIIFIGIMILSLGVYRNLG